MTVVEVEIEVGSKKALKSLNDLEQAQEALLTQLKQTDIGTAEYTRLQKQLKKVGSELKDLELGLEALDKEQRATALVDTFNGLVGAVGAVSSAFIAFGADSEAIEEAEKKLLGVVGVVQGLTDASNGLVAAGKLIGPSLKTAFTTATGAINGTKVALASIGIGVLITGIGLLITYWDDLAALVSDTNKDFELTSDALDDIASSTAPVIANIETLTRTVNDETKSTKERKRALDDLNKIYKQYGINQVKDINDTETLIKNKKRLNEILITEAKIRGAQDAITKLTEERIQSEIKGLKELDDVRAEYADRISESEAKLAKARTGQFIAFGLTQQQTIEGLQKDIQTFQNVIDEADKQRVIKLKNAEKDYQDALKPIYDFIDFNQEYLSGLQDFTPPPAGGEGSKEVTDTTIKNLKAQVDAQKTTLAEKLRLREIEYREVIQGINKLNKTEAEKAEDRLMEEDIYNQERQELIEQYYKNIIGIVETSEKNVTNIKDKEGKIDKEATKELNDYRVATVKDANATIIESQIDLADTIERINAEEYQRINDQATQYRDLLINSINQFVGNFNGLAIAYGDSVDTIIEKVRANERRSLEQTEGDIRARLENTVGFIQLTQDALKKSYDEQIKAAEGNVEEQTRLQNEYLQKYTELEDLKVKVTQQAAGEIIDAQDEVAANAEENAQKTADAFKSILDLNLTLFNELSNLQQQLAQQQFDDELKNLDRLTKARIKAAGDDAEMVAKINADAALQEEILKKKAFDSEKKRKIALAQINTAAAVLSILAETPKGDFGIATAALIAAALGTSAIQIAAIQKTEYIPAYAEGGLVSGPGTGTSDSILARVSSGEFIVNSKSTQRYLPVLNQINDSTSTVVTSEGKLAQETPIFKTYVLAGDVISAQDAQQKLNQKRKL